MAVADLYNQHGEKIGTTELPPTAFNSKVNEAVVHQYMRVYQWRNHPHLASARTRGEVRGSGRKPWRQKGTGRARAGTRSSPLWRGGGVVFPPKPVRRRMVIPKKMKRIALRSLLSDRAREGRVKVLEDIKLTTIKTAQIKSLLTALELDDRREKKLFITPEVDKSFYLSARNLPDVYVKHVGELNTYDLLLAENLVVMRSALPLLEERVKF